MTDPAATLHALANYYKRLGDVSPSDRTEWFALAEHVEGIAQRHHPDQLNLCDYCIDSVNWPCIEVTELLAVAAAAGITP